MKRGSKAVAACQPFVVCYAMWKVKPRSPLSKQSVTHLWGQGVFPSQVYVDPLLQAARALTAQG